MSGTLIVSLGYDVWGRRKELPEGGHAVASTSCFFSTSRLLKWIDRGNYLFRVGAAKSPKENLELFSTANNLRYRYL